MGKSNARNICTLSMVDLNKELQPKILTSCSGNFSGKILQRWMEESFDPFTLQQLLMRMPFQGEAHPFLLLPLKSWKLLRQRNFCPAHNWTEPIHIIRSTRFKIWTWLSRVHQLPSHKVAFEHRIEPWHFLLAGRGSTFFLSKTMRVTKKNNHGLEFATDREAL